jgi:hypothetical protein
MNQTNQLKRTMTRILLAFMLILAGYAGGFAQALSIDFKQAGNKSPSAGKIEWINGIVNASNSFYYEGMAVPQRIILDGLQAGQSRTIVIKHQTLKSAKSAHGYDFLTSWENAEEVARRFSPSKPLLLDVIATRRNDASQKVSEASSNCNPLNNAVEFKVGIPSPNSNPVPTFGVGQVSVKKQKFESAMNQSKNELSIWVPSGNTISELSFSFIEYRQGDGDQDAIYELTFTPSGTQAAIEFAGHLASGVDFFDAEIGWGLGKGSGGISGGSYHVYVDGNNIGNQDNQVSDIGIKSCDINITNAVQTNVSCNGGSNGSLDLTVAGTAEAPFQYSWTGPSSFSTTTLDITGLKAGTYNLTINDATGFCDIKQSYTITEPDAVTLTAIVKNMVSCNGDANGELTITTNGTAVIKDELGNVVTNGSLKAGKYTVSSSKAGNNGATCDATSVEVTITQPAQALAASATTSTTECAGTKTGSITLSVSGGTALYEYKLNGGTLTNLPANGIIASLQAGNYTVYVQDANGCNVTIQGNVTVAEGPVCYPYYTYSQGYYGNTNGLGVACVRGDGTWRTRDFIKKSLENGGGMILGSTNTNERNNGLNLRASLTAGIAQTAVIENILKVMPGGGSPNILTQSLDLTGTYSATNKLLKNGKFNNVLLGQTVAMWLNINIPNNELGSLDLKGLKCKTTIVTKEADSKSTCNIPHAGETPVFTVFPQSVVNALISRNKGTTVRDLVNMASEALGRLDKTYYNASLTDINAALDAIVNAFHGGKYFARFQGDINGCSITTPPGGSVAKINVASPVEEAAAVKVETSNAGVSVIAFPNPYIDQVTFNVTVKNAGKGSLVIYNMLGQKVTNLFEGNMQANSTQTIRYNVPFAQRKNLVYVFRQNDTISTGKLVSGK